MNSNEKFKRAPESIDSDITHIEYVKKYAHTNLGSTVIKLSSANKSIQKFIDSQATVNSELQSFLENYKYSDSEIENISNVKKEKEKTRLQQKHFNKARQRDKHCKNCKKITCPYCFKYKLFTLKRQQSNGSKSEGRIYKVLNTMFILQIWLFARLDELEAKYSNDFSLFFKQAQIISQKNFFEAHCQFPSIYPNTFILDYVANPVVLDENQNINNPIIAGGANLFMHPEKTKLAKNHKAVLELIFFQFQENIDNFKKIHRFKQYISKELKIPAINVDTFLKNAENIEDIDRFLQNSTNLKNMDSKTETNLLEHEIQDKKFAERITQIIPDYSNMLIVGVCNIYKYDIQRYKFNEEKLHEQQKFDQQTETRELENLQSERKKQFRPVYVGMDTNFEQKYSGAVTMANDFFEENANASSSVFFRNTVALPRNVFNFIKNFSLKPMQKIYDIKVQMKKKSNLDNFPIQNKTISLNSNALKHDLLIHAISNICINPSWIESQTLLERLVDKYIGSDQLDFVYLYEFMPDLNNFVKYVLFHKMQNANVNPNYLSTDEEKELSILAPQYDLYFQKDRDNIQIHEIYNRFIELAKYFKLGFSNNIKPSILEKFKFNEILNFISFEATLLTQLDFSDKKHDKLVDLEKLFQLTEYSQNFKQKNGKNCIFHSFCLNNQVESSNGKIVDNLIFKYPPYEQSFYKDFLQTTTYNINLVFANTTIPEKKGVLRRKRCGSVSNVELQKSKKPKSI